MIDNKQPRDRMNQLRPVAPVPLTCIYCGIGSEDPRRASVPCCAPDGDGHLFLRQTVTACRQVSGAGPVKS